MDELIRKRREPIGRMLGGRSFRWVTMALVVLPVLYTLSVGPLVCLTRRGYVRDNSLSGSLCRAYLTPVQEIYEGNHQPLCAMLDWYISFFPAPPPTPLNYDSSPETIAVPVEGM